uniref:Protein kinase domain-containing protein n=1 Tax=Moniliophthora roreri TaxID=221103 RepID=A0A0W0GDN8_MONRR
MAYLQGSSDFTIQGKQFTNLQGFHHINHFSGILVVQQASMTEKEPTIWDEYKQIRNCDLYLTRLVDTEVVTRHDAETGQRLRAHRVISVAKLYDDKDNHEFLHVQYHGQDAYKEFKRDFRQFSSIKHPNFVQLYGYNNAHRTLPALIFCDGAVPPIPLERIICARGRPSSILFAYFSYQLGMQHLAGNNYDSVFAIDQLWIEPRSSALLRGPHIQSHYGDWAVPAIRSNSTSSYNFTPLRFQTYDDTQSILDYLTKSLATRTILQGIHWSHGDPVFEETDVSVLPSLHTVYNRRHGKPIARWAKVKFRHQLQYVCDVPDAIREGQIVMADGSVRFTVTQTDLQHFEAITLTYTPSSAEETSVFVDSWLTQAHGVFSQLGIHRGECEEYCLLHGFHLSFHRFEECALREGNTNIAQDTRPVYLFIRPVPQPSDGGEICRFWAKSRKYYWSLDESGIHDPKMSEATQKSMGLPSFASKINVIHRGWVRDAYGVVQKIHSVHGFNPVTTDLARSLGLPILDVISDDDRFKDCEDFEVDLPASEGFDSDEEIVLYPRQKHRSL